MAIINRQDENLHVIPINDLREHDDSPDCWCNPIADEEYPNVWTHNSMDGREHTVEKGVMQ